MVTDISYTLERKEHVRLQVYGADGVLHTTLLNEEQSPGSKSLVWDTEHLSPGLYVLRLVTAERQESIRLVKQ